MNLCVLRHVIFNQLSVNLIKPKRLLMKMFQKTRSKEGHCTGKLT
jgi:hypothetical protein